MPESLTKYMFKNYFLMLAKASVQSAMDQMELYRHKVEDGDTLESIAKFDYTIKADDTLEKISEVFNVSKEELIIVNPGLSEPLTPGSIIKIPVDVMPENIVKANQSQTDILRPGIGLLINGQSYTIIENDSFASIAEKFNISLNDLAVQIKDFVNIFKLGTEVIIPNVPVITLDKLKQKILKSGDFNNIAAMTSAYMLNGLRLPEPNNNTKTYPLFTLDGQQFNVEDKKIITLKTDSDWINFVGGTKKGELEVSLDENEINTLKDIGSFLDMANIRAHRLPLYTYIPERYALSQKYDWQCPNLPQLKSQLKCLEKISEYLIIQPDIWTFPESLQKSLIAKSTNGNLFYELVTTCYEDASAPNKTKDVRSYCFGTAFDLYIYKVTGGGQKDMPNTYLLEGTDEKGMEILFELKKYLDEKQANNTNKTEITELYLLYEPEATSANPAGFVSDDLNKEETVILKTNLSTESHQESPTGSKIKMMTGMKSIKFHSEPVEDTGDYSAAIEENNKFITFLWECTIVKTGGYYLHYKKDSSNGDNGLPEYIFGDKGMARLKLVVVVDEQNETTNRKILHFNNCAIVGDNIDTSSMQLSVQPLTHMTKIGDTLNGILDYDEYKFIKDKISLEHFFNINQNIENLLKTGEQINGYEMKYGDTLESFRQENNLSIADLASLKIFKPEVLLQFSENSIHKHSVVPPGNIGFEVVRDNPDQMKQKNIFETLKLVDIANSIKDVPDIFPDKTVLKIPDSEDGYLYVSSLQGIANKIFEVEEATDDNIKAIATTNAELPLNGGIDLIYEYVTLTTSTTDEDTLSSMAIKFNNGEFPTDEEKYEVIKSIAVENKDVVKIFPDDTIILRPSEDEIDYHYVSSLQTIATKLNSHIEAISNENEGVKLEPGIEFCFEDKKFTTGENDTLKSMTDKFKHFFERQWEMCQRFHLLGFRILGNDFFNTSKEGLPISPTIDEGDD